MRPSSKSGNPLPLELTGGEVDTTKAFIGKMPAIKFAIETGERIELADKRPLISSKFLKLTIRLNA